MSSIGSLFSGIGGLELGLEAAGLGRVRWQVERDAFRRAVLAKHWPDADRFDDVREVGAFELARVTGICGGSPCQGFSQAGKRRGFDDERSGLWSEMRRIVGELFPRWVIWENVLEARRCGALAAVARDLGALGYETRDLDITGPDVGATQRRPRCFVLAVRRDDRREGSEAGNGPRGPLDEQPGDDADRCGMARPEGGPRAPAESRVGRAALRLPEGMDGYPAPRGSPPHAWEAPRTLEPRTRGTMKRARLEALGDCVIPAVGKRAGLELARMLKRAP